MKAEQQIAQSRFARETAGPSGLSSSLGRRRNQDGANTTSDKRDSFQVLFPHLLKQNEENGEEEGCQPPPVFATPKKTAYSPTKGDGGTPSRRVVFNMEHQPKTPSSGKKTRRSILKSTPSKSAGTGDNLAPSGMMGLLARGDRLSSLRDGYTTPTKTTRSGENAASPLGYENHRTPPSQATRKSPRRELGIPESRIVLTPLKLSGCQDPKKGTSPAKVIKQEVVSPIKGEKEKNPAPLANESLEKPIEHNRIAISSCERVEEPESETENVVDGEAAEEPSLPNLDKNRIVGMKTAAKDIALQIDKKSRESLTAGLQIEKAIESRKAEYSKFLTSYKEDKVNEKLNEDTTTSVDNMGASEKPEEPSKTDQPKKDAGAAQKRRPPSTSGPDNSVLRRSTVVVPSNVAHNIGERKKPSSFTSEEISSRPKPKFPEDENQTADRDSFGQEQSDSRPSRIRSRTTKFGIDDITVAQLISPNKFASPRSLAKAQKNEPDKGITSPLPSSAVATLTPGRASKSPVVIKLNPKGGNSISNNMEDRFSQLLEEPPNSVIISPRTYQRGPRSSNDDPETTAMPEKNDTVFMEDGVAPLSDIEDIGSPKGKKAKSPPKARKRLSNEILQSLRLQAQNDSKMRSAREEEKPRRSLEIEPTDDDDEEAPSVKVKEKSRPKDVAGSDKKSGEPSRKSRANNRRSRSQSQDSADDQAASQDLESEVEVTKQSKKQSLSIKNSNKSRRQSQEETTVVAESGPKKEGRNKKRRSQTNSDAEKDDKERKEASENNRNIKKETESATDGESSELKSKSRKHKKNKKSRRDRESMEDVTSQDMVEVSQVVESDETIVGPHTPERPSDTDDAMRPSRKRTLTNRYLSLIGSLNIFS